MRMTQSWRASFLALWLAGGCTGFWTASAAGATHCIAETTQPNGLYLNRYQELKPLRESTDRARGSGEPEYKTGKFALILVGLLVERSPGHPILPGSAPELSKPVQVRAQVFAIGKDGNRTALCSHQSSLRVNTVIMLRVESEEPVQHLAIHYSSVKPLPSDVVVKASVSSTVQTAIELFPLSCPEVVPSALQEIFELRHIDQATIGPGMSCRHRIVTKSPHSLLVSFRQSQVDNHPVDAKLSAGFKPANSYAGFAKLCGAEFKGQPSGAYLVGLDSSLPVLRDGVSQLWALDIAADCSAEYGLEIDVFEVVPKVGIAIVEDRAPIAPAYGAPAYLTDLRLSCFSDLKSHMFVDAFRRRKANVDGKTFLDIVVARRNGTLMPHERALVEKAAMYAISAWNRSCLICGPDGLSIARVNGELFASSLIIELLNAASDGLATQPGTTPRSLAGDVLVEDWSMRVTSNLRARVPAFLRMTPRDVSILCGSIWLTRLFGQGASCVRNQPIAENEGAVLRIVLTDGYTVCDSDPDTIACEQYGTQIEFNIRDFTYVVDSNLEVAFGRGKRSVSLDLVIAHEIGHWLGLGHVDSLDAIMSTTTTNARCISNADVDALMMLNAASALPRPAINALKYK